MAEITRKDIAVKDFLPTGKRTLLYIPAGALAALPVCFSQLSLFAFIFFVPLCFLLFAELTREDLPRRAGRYYLVGLAALMPYFMVVFHWFTALYPLDFVGGMTPAVAVAIIALACIGLPLLQALGFAVLFPLLAGLSRARAVRRAPLLMPFLFAALWALFAYTQTLTWAGVPWGAQLAISQHPNLWFLSSASFFGSYFVTFVIAAVNALLAYVLLLFLRGARLAARLPALLAAGVFLLNFGLSGLSYALPVTEERRMTVAVLQGNISSSDKWATGTDSIAIYRTLAAEAAAEGAELMVWPETAVNTYLIMGQLARVQQIAAETGAIQIVGAFAPGQDGAGKHLRYNALYLIYPDGRVSEHVYHKRHLVPFGEYVPMRDVIEALFPPLANLEMLQDGTDLTPGAGPNLFEEEFGCIGGLVCFDSIYEDLARESVAAGAEILAISTNDSWFFDSAAVYQHNGQAVLRAVENGRYVMRAANTGISSVITAKGEVLCEIAPLIRGQATVEVAFVSSTTLYTRIGNLFLLACQIFVLIPPGEALASYLLRRSKNRKENRHE